RIELWRPPLEWRRSMSALGGGCLINDGVHQLYTLRWLLGDYKGVFALLGNYAQREMEGEDTASLLVQFKNGAIGEVTTTWACVLPATPRPTPTIELRGKESTVLASPWEHRAKLYRRGQKTDAFEEWTAPSVQRDALTTASAPNAWVATVRDEIRDFVECIVEDREPPITAQDGRAVLQVILGAYESAQRQSWVELH
ncbi:MAG: Gfo/Idh/MocA family oxidoreductase, partial [Candidatus Bathyarchaeia archaeon]